MNVLKVYPLVSMISLPINLFPLHYINILHFLSDILSVLLRKSWIVKDFKRFHATLTYLIRLSLYIQLDLHTGMRSDALLLDFVLFLETNLYEHRLKILWQRAWMFGPSSNNKDIRVIVMHINEGKNN